MPELPEVETIKNGLHKIIGLKITNLLVLNPKTFSADPSEVKDKKVLKIWRRAKILGIDLEGDLTLMIHLKMSGQLIFIDGKKRFIGGHPTEDWLGQMPNKSTRVIIEFGDGGDLYFNDQRKFGWIKLVNSSSLIDNSLLNSLGPEPLEKDFTWEVLKKQLSGHRGIPIKVAIMDQHSISGIGNIYASEALFNAKIDPKTKVSAMTDEQWQKLHAGILWALKNGIEKGGSSRAHFVNADGEKGLFLDYAFVYQREGEKCKVCGTEIQRIQQGGRSTFFCPKCQK